MDETESEQALDRDTQLEQAQQDKQRLESELAYAHSQLEAERRAKESLSSEKDRYVAQYMGVNAQLSSLKSSTEGGLRQQTELRNRLEQVEQEKRDILGSLQREREESMRKGQEIETLLARQRESRKETFRLGSVLQEAQSQESIAKYKLQAVEQELHLVKKDAEWTHDQLTKVNESSAAFRTAKRVEITSLQTQLDAATQQVSATNTKFASLQSAYDEANARLIKSSEKVAELTTRLASQEDSFRSEISSQSQLTKLLERRAEHSTDRIAELENQWEQVLEQCRAREEAAWAETQKEVLLRESLESQNQELSEALDRLAESLGISQHRNNDEVEEIMSDAGGIDFDLRSTVSTPRRSFMGTAASFNGLHAHSLSPTADIANRMRSSGKNFSQVYIELAKSQEELRRERLETNRLTEVLSQVMNELQDRAPQLQAQREETEQLAADLQQMVQQVAVTSQERDDAKAEATRFELELENITRENGLMSQQLADFGRQVRELVKTIIMRDDPDAADRLQDNGLAAELDAIAPFPVPVNESDTQTVITMELVTFTSLAELCAQNARLLQVTRQLGDKMEEEERNYKARLADDQDEVVSEARDLIERLEEQIHTERRKLEEVSKERDLFRQLCSTGGRTEEPKPDSQPIAAAPVSQPTGFMQAEYEAVRSRLDSLKRETDADIARYKEEVRGLETELSRVTVTHAREQALRQAADEKYTTLQRTVKVQKSELDALQNRVNSLQASYSQRESMQQSMEEKLTEHQSTVNHLRSQVAHLQAEKDSRKSAESKLLEDNRQLLTEKSDLQEVVRNTQAMQAELESRGKQVNTRLEQDLQRLQESYDDLQNRFGKEQELYRERLLRHEIETKDYQTKIDTSTTELSNAREALAIARTSADHIQLRVEDLTRQLESSREKLSVYERRDQLARDPVAFRTQTEGEFSREEQLEIELSDLKAGRAAAQAEVQRTRLQIDELTTTLAHKEAELTNATNALEEARTAGTSDLETKAKEIEALQVQMQTIGEELATAQREKQELAEQIQAQNLAFQAEKKSLEDAFTELSSVEERAAADHENIKSEMRKHVQAAKDAEQKLVEIERVRDQLTADLNDAREQLAKSRQDASSLRTAKDLSEAEYGRDKGSWDTSRQVLEREKTDLQRRMDDLTGQNEILHSHLETINAQANQIRQMASAPLPPVDGDLTAGSTKSESAVGETEIGATGEADAPAPEVETNDVAMSEDVTPTQTEEKVEDVKVGDTTSSGAELSASVLKRRADEYREVVNYLRREKEIVDLQMELNKQETARLKQSLEHVNKVLSETRSELDSERAKNASAASLETHHAELLEKINALHELRSAHATLQEAADRSTARLAQVESELAAARTELAPLSQSLQDTQVELESSQAQANILRQDAKRWQTRAESLLQTHGLDEEKQKSEQQRAEAQTKIEELEKQLSEQQAATEAVKAELTTSKEKFEALRAQVKARIGQEREAVSELRVKLEALQKEKDEEQTRFKEVIRMREESVERLTAERDQLSKELKDGKSGTTTPALTRRSPQVPTEPITVMSSDEEDAGEEGMPQKSKRQLAIEAAVRQAQVQFDQVKAQLEEEKAQIAAARDKHLANGRNFLSLRRAAEGEVKKRDETIAQLRKDFDATNAEAIEHAVRARIDSAAASDGDQATTIAQLRAQVQDLEAKLAATEARIRELEAQLKTTPSGATASEHEAELRQLEASLTEKYALQQKTAVEEAFQRGQESGKATAGSSNEDVEETVQKRLKALEDEREKAVAEAIRSAVQAREAELKTQHDESSKARFEAGKNEANLRNQLMIKQKDNKIAKLTAEIAQWKGEEVPAPAAGGSTPAVAATSGPARPGVFGRGGAQAAARGGRGGSAGQVSARPTPASVVIPIGPGSGQPVRPTASIRGAASATRGAPIRIANTATAAAAAAAARGGRGGLAQQAGGGGGGGAAGAKRKLSAQGLPQTPTAAAASTDGAAAPKRPRPAGAPVALRKPDTNSEQ